ncbi:MAG: hypothetical protein GY796_13100 [Chloroflexi bacterium]|nr:hypothetical protein [Chloroflexota bacterium]
MGRILVNSTCGKDDVERASLAFVVGNTALASGQEATLMLTISGVWVATKGYTDGLQADGFQPLGELVQDFIANNGRVWVCNACANPRQISADDLIEGAQMIGAATAVDALVSGAQTLSF